MQLLVLEAFAGLLANTLEACQIHSILWGAWIPYKLYENLSGDKCFGLPNWHYQAVPAHEHTLIR